MAVKSQTSRIRCTTTQGTTSQNPLKATMAYTPKENSSVSGISVLQHYPLCTKHKKSPYFLRQLIRLVCVHGVTTPIWNLLLYFFKDIVDLQADALNLFVPKRKSLLNYEREENRTVAKHFVSLMPNKSRKLLH